MSWSFARRRARADDRLRAVVRGRRSLRYDGAAPGRPAHVRAASGLAWIGEELALVQDDCLFVALVDPRRGTVRSIALPVGPDDARAFDDELGNKACKPDLEACIVVPCDGEDRLVALGSGSSPARERIAVVSPATGSARFVEAPRWYAMLRAIVDFAGSELNVEGAVVHGDSLRLLQRGNGAPRGELRPCNAIAEISWGELWDHLCGRRSDPPGPRNIVQYALGEIEGVRLGFTDGARAPGDRMAFLAAAEASPDAIADGPVAGTVLGVVDPDGDARTCVLPLRAKAEGLAIDPGDAGRAFVAIDPDDPREPATLLELELAGPWWEK